MSVDTDRYVTGVQKRLTKIADPVERARAANDEISALGDALETLGKLRADAVRTARETKSAQTVAGELGVTRARVYQLLQ